MKKLYSTIAKVTGGREGSAQTTDERLKLKLTMPKELGGKENSSGTNPEQLFAVGYGACFENAVRHVARLQKINLTQSSVVSEVSLFAKDSGGFQLGVRMQLSLPELDTATAQALLDEADRICPYSNAVRGNIEVEISLAK